MDLDRALKFGSSLDVGDDPYVRVHKVCEGGGVAGPETEQFASGSIFKHTTQGTGLYSEPAVNPDGPIDTLSTIVGLDSFAWIEALLHRIKEVAARAGTFNGIQDVESVSHAEYPAKKELCQS